jgi:hypothetical protein
MIRHHGSESARSQEIVHCIVEQAVNLYAMKNKFEFAYTLVLYLIHSVMKITSENGGVFEDMRSRSQVNTSVLKTRLHELREEVLATEKELSYREHVIRDTYQTFYIHKISWVMDNAPDWLKHDVTYLIRGRIYAEELDGLEHHLATHFRYRKGNDEELELASKIKRENEEAETQSYCIHSPLLANLAAEFKYAWKNAVDTYRAAWNLHEALFCSISPAYVPHAFEWLHAAAKDAGKDVRECMHLWSPNDYSETGESQTKKKIRADFLQSA